MSAAKKIKEYLLSGGELTVLKARELFHTTELRVVIARLRKKEFKIVSEKIDHVEDDGYHFLYYMEDAHDLMESNATLEEKFETLMEM